jgi:hypothetical protein
MILHHRQISTGKYVQLFSVFLLTLVSISVQAKKLGDVEFPDTVTLDGTRTPLQLNGMGYRTKFFFKIYVGGLYTEKKVSTTEQVLALKGPKRVIMHMVYDEVSGEKMANAWQEGFEDNNSEAQLKALSSRLSTLKSYFDDMKAGDVILLDYMPGKGTVVTIRGKQKGIIEGDDFYNALLKVWLGDDPADEDLKTAMLGADESGDD